MRTYHLLPYAASPGPASSERAVCGVSCRTVIIQLCRCADGGRTTDVLPGHHLARILAAGRTVRHGAGSTMGHPHHLLSFTDPIIARAGDGVKPAAGPGRRQTGRGAAVEPWKG